MDTASPENSRLSSSASHGGTPGPDVSAAPGGDDAGAGPEAGSRPQGAPDAPAAPPPETAAQKVDALRRRADDESKAWARLATLLRPLSSDDALADLAKAPAAVAKADAALAELPPAAAALGAEALAIARADIDARRQRIREGLSRELNAQCTAAGLTLRVVRREEPVEVRIAPLAVSIDREKGTAEIRFARVTLESCGADAAEILAARARAIRALDTPFDGPRYFEACRAAWLAARAVGAATAGSGDRVEILDFLPYLALQLQKPAFRVDPSEKNFEGYSRVRFVWDLLRLRRAGLLSQDGMRLNLGVATGTTATAKNRALWVEDENGDGEFKLTVFFTRTEVRA